MRVAHNARAGRSSSSAALGGGQPLWLTLMSINFDADFERNESTVRRSQPDLAVIIPTYNEYVPNYSQHLLANVPSEEQERLFGRINCGLLSPFGN